MASAADFADEFVSKARAGARPKVRVQKQYVAAFLGQLIREGIRLANDCLDHVSDPQLREIIQTMLMSAAAGALLGAAVGSTTGPQGAKIGAAIGAGIGVAAAVLAIVIRLREESGPNGPELIVEAA